MIAANGGDVTTVDHDATTTHPTARSNTGRKRLIFKHTSTCRERTCTLNDNRRAHRTCLDTGVFGGEPSDAVCSGNVNGSVAQTSKTRPGIRVLFVVVIISANTLNGDIVKYHARAPVDGNPHRVVVHIERAGDGPTVFNNDGIIGGDSGKVEGVVAAESHKLHRAIVLPIGNQRQGGIGGEVGRQAHRFANGDGSGGSAEV